tara:strand:- start:158 stop:520 length:363 start_codon:yes stop_codon:yes gene_type:complete
MNLFLRVVLIIGLSYAAQTFFPWWSAVVVALLVEAILGKGDNTSFFSGFYGIAIPWIIISAYIDIKSESILTVRILELFKLPQFSSVLIVLTGLIGGLVGGVSSMVGGWIKDAILHTNGK